MLFNPDNNGRAGILAQFANFSSNLKFADIARYIRQAEEDYIIPYLSQAQYEDLEAKFQGNLLSEFEEKLLLKAQDALAQYAFAESVDEISTKVSANGAGKNQMTDFEHNAPVDNFILKRDAFDKADKELDKMLAYLEEKKDIFTFWANSTNRVLINALVISTATEFHRIVSIFPQSGRLFAKLQSSMQDVQALSIDPLIGAVFREYLKQQSIDNALTAKEAEAWGMLKKFFAYKTIERALEMLTLTIENGALCLPSFIRGKDQYKAAEIKEAQRIAQQFGRQAQEYIDSLLAYLSANIDDFPTYRDSGKYTPPSAPSTYCFESLIV